MSAWRRDRTLTERARSNRREMNAAERLVRSHLRRGRLGYRFRGQEPLAGYVVDFVCLDRNPIVEVDGETHTDQKADTRRDHNLATLGYRTLRFRNHDVYERQHDVIETIARALEEG